VVRVVEEQLVVAAPRAVLAHARDEGAVVPLVDEDEVGARECVIEVERRRVVAPAFELRKFLPELFDQPVAVFGQKVLQTPGVARLVDAHVHAARLQLRHHAAQEVRVAVVPVRDQRVIEHHDAHAAATSLSFESGQPMSAA
jgi:hypothetical protein